MKLRVRAAASLGLRTCVLAALAAGMVLGASPRAYAQDPGSAQQTGAGGQTAGGQVSGGQQAIQAPLMAPDAIDPNQPIEPGFEINVSVDQEPEPSGNYVVDSAGTVLIHIAQMLAPVAVKDQTPQEASSTLSSFLLKYIKQPKVTVTIVAKPQRVVVIGGAVKQAGPAIIGDSTTLVDLLSRVGWTDNADLSQVRLERAPRGGGAPVLSIIHADTYMRPIPGVKLDASENPLLQDKDNIFVPFKSLSGAGVITVAGAVTKPQLDMPLRIDPPLTLREAISLCGGVTQEADHRRITVRRAGNPVPLELNLDLAEKNDPSNNIELRPDDSIYVETLNPVDYFEVCGGFFKAGKYPMDQPTTLTQAIMQAGGIAPYAKVKDGWIIRHKDGDPKDTQILAFHWSDVLSHKTPDIAIQPGDSIWIQPGAPSGPLGLLGALSSLAPLRYLVP